MSQYMRSQVARLPIILSIMLLLGFMVYGLYGHFQVYNLISCCVQSASPATFAQIQDLVLANLYSTLLTNTLTCVVIYLLIDRIMRPLRMLSAVVKRVAAGPRNTPPIEQTNDKISTLIGTFARQMSQMRQALTVLERRQREAETLRTSVLALNSTLDLSAVLHLILSELRQVVPYDSASLQLIQGDQAEIISFSGPDYSEQLIGQRFPLTPGANPNYEVAHVRAAIILDDAPRAYPLFQHVRYREGMIRSWLGVPLLFNNRLIGMLTIDNHEPGFYQEAHATLAEAFAAQAAIAIENARLYALAQQELADRRRSEEQTLHLTAIIESTTDLVATFDMAGRATFLNKAGYTLLGIGEDFDLTQLNMNRYMSPELAQLMNDHYVPAAIRDGVWSGTHTIIDGNGKDMPVSQVVIAHTDAEGNPLFLSSIVRDMSDTLRAEEQLRQAQKMEAVGRLAGGVAHDFNNILTVVIGECDLLLLDPGVPEPLRNGLEQIRRSSAHAASLTNQLLAFSRRQVLKPTIVNLNSIVLPIEQMLSRLIGEDIVLSTMLDPQLASVRADASQLEQVILNLCINARDAMPTGGSLKIGTTNISPAQAVAKGLAATPYVLLAICDTGNGIAPEIREHVFEPFFTTKERGKGTGLGLSTVHGIVQQSGGCIQFESQLNQGTSFFIYLPAVQSEVLANEVPVISPSSNELGKTVLLVEDDDGVRRLASRILLRHGYSVIEAANGLAAQHVVAKHRQPIDLMISDIIMPGGINGVQLSRILRSEHPDLKILLMSGYTEDALSDTGGLSDDIAFIQKPFTSGELLGKLRETLIPS